MRYLKRLHFRQADGRFRRATLADIGAGCCEVCLKLFVPDTSKARVGGFVDPFKLAKIKTHCPECLEKSV
jgi:hypothetical protein